MSAEHRISVKALLRNEGDILVLREATGDNSGKYHFPGGHLNPGESMRDGLRREVAEETGITDLHIGEPYFACEWQASIGGQMMRIVGIFLPCHTSQRETTLSGEHDHALWMPPADYVSHPMVNLSDQIISRYLELESIGGLHL